MNQEQVADRIQHISRQNGNFADGILQITRQDRITKVNIYTLIYRIRAYRMPAFYKIWHFLGCRQQSFLVIFCPKIPHFLMKGPPGVLIKSGVLYARIRYKVFNFQISKYVIIIRDSPIWPQVFLSSKCLTGWEAPGSTRPLYK